ncbi:hypothetical protein [Methylovulum psychrotolerans]|uniref:DUF1302 domain-containing protein n=1 Tax=Methylovulum psychrotolerans TaxID=1704499 RepID=A0A1Z4C4G3_9GAMM|nr:hypothetical protein [Methylovulum psychrotolerans]ASF48437.1 hypothetical protein CEK71_21570 [Methylovulum psychrotolerans]MBT9097480.1 hypothetical protein [Methylovulum psychrotolerans]
MTIFLKKNKLNASILVALQALGLSLGGVASSAAMADSTYFKYSNAYYSNATARQKMTIYTRGTPDKTSDSTYSGACTYSYGANSDPAMNEGESGKTSTTFSQYLTTTERDYRFNNNSEFLLGAFVDYIAPSVPLPLYSSVPHFCETTPADSTRDKTTIGNILYNNVRTGAFLRLRSLDDSENIFNFEFAQDRINMETKSENWWKDALGWSQYFYPNFTTLGSFHGPDASLAFKNSEVTLLSTQTPVGQYQHLYLNYSLKNNVQNSVFNTVPYGVNTQAYSGTPPSTGQTTYDASKHGGGLRFGVTFRFVDDGTFCGATSTGKKYYSFNLVENIFDERFEYIDQNPDGTINTSFQPLAVDPATGQNMYRYPLRNLVDYNAYVIPATGFHYNPFKVRGITTSIANKDLIPVLNSVIPNLVAGGAFPAMPTCAGKTAADYYAFILNNMYVPTASTGYETGGINDLSFSLFEFSLVGTNTAR